MQHVHSSIFGKLFAHQIEKRQVVKMRLLIFVILLLFQLVQLRAQNVTTASAMMAETASTAVTLTGASWENALTNCRIQGKTLPFTDFTANSLENVTNDIWLADQLRQWGMLLFTKIFESIILEEARGWKGLGLVTLIIFLNYLKSFLLSSATSKKRLESLLGIQTDSHIAVCIHCV